MLIFDSIAPTVNSETFGTGIVPTMAELIAASKAEVANAPDGRVKRVGYTSLDRAWHSGYSCTYDAGPGETVFPPADMLGEELEALIEGSEWAQEQIDADMSSAWDAASEADEDAERHADWVALTGGRD